jgi:putative heme-binding domain-containing protein
LLWTWQPQQAQRRADRRAGWTPHPDPDIAAGLLAGSALGKDYRACLEQFGTLELRGRLRPEPDRTELLVVAAGPFQVQLEETTARASAINRRAFMATLPIPAGETSVGFRLRVSTGGRGPIDLRVFHSSDGGVTGRTVPPQHFEPPWVLASGADTDSKPEPEVATVGGDHGRGKELFFGEKLRCGSCHRVRAEGATTGPDLSNLVHRDAASVLRDIRDPSATLHPDYVTFNLVRDDGELLSGFVREQSASKVRLVAPDGIESVVRRDAIRRLEPSAISLMPVGLVDALTEAETRDLLAFLLHEPRRRTPAAGGQ